MIFVITDEKYKYELEKLCRLYLPFEKFVFSDEREDITDLDNSVFIGINDNDLLVELSLFGKKESRNEQVNVGNEFTDIERKLALMLFDCFYSVTGYRSPWGILTGVRPAKLMGRLINELGEQKATEYFKDILMVSEAKTKLCLDSFRGEENIIERSTPDSFSLYISIPFCPSRCSYCSFVSHSVEMAKKLIPQYVELLCKELEVTAGHVKEIGLKLKSIYIGGGTPTTFTAEQLGVVMKTVSDNFDLSNLEEYTVEAGRPDTITAEKLVAIKNGGATRISINPQTMNDAVLEKIGRRHTTEQTVKAYNLARECGFDNINMDLIAGLLGDDLESFKNTVDKIIELSPENVTVHSLSMKRASNLNKSQTEFDLKQGNDAAFMVDYALSRLKEAGIKPYYMYRQSKTVGNLENVGYSKKGFEGIYNVYIMDETHSIIACGASAVTKLRQPGGNFIERIFNYKYPYEYINNFDEILSRKEGIKTFYGKYGQGLIPPFAIDC